MKKERFEAVMKQATMNKNRMKSGENNGFELGFLSGVSFTLTMEGNQKQIDLINLLIEEAMIIHEGKET